MFAAYAITRIRYKGAQWVGGAIFLAYLVPPSILFIPLSTVVFQYGLFDTPFALILTYPTILIPFSTWLLMGYFKTIPYELEECALIDGATRWQILIKIILPLAVPGLISAVDLLPDAVLERVHLRADLHQQHREEDRAGGDPVGLHRRRPVPLGLADGRRAGRLAAAGDPVRVLRRALRVGDDRRGQGVGESRMKIGFIGLGAMGAPMAAKLVAAGHAVRGFDVRAGAVEALVAAGRQGGRLGAPTRRSDAELLWLMVVNGEQAESVLFGDGAAAAALPQGALVVAACTQAPAQAPGTAERLAACGLVMLDAPVSGGVAGAKAGGADDHVLGRRRRARARAAGVRGGGQAHLPRRPRGRAWARPRR